MCDSRFGLVVSTCQVTGYKDSSDDTFMWRDYFPQSPDGRECVYFCRCEIQTSTVPPSEQLKRCFCFNNTWCIERNGMVY